MELDHVKSVENIDAVRSFSDPVERVRSFDKWALTYDKDITAGRKGAPEKFAVFVTKFVNDRNLSIIEIGAGTGLFGVELKRAGFSNLHGHDGSKEMLKLAQERGTYSKLFQEILFDDTPSKTIQKGGYDLLVSLGAFSAGGILNEKYLEALIDLVKPGGMMFLGFRSDVITEAFERQMMHLSNRCRLLEKQTVPDYIEHRDSETGQVVALMGTFVAFEII